MKVHLKKTAIVCFFELYPINNGASEVIIGLYKYIKGIKKIFFIKDINKNIYYKLSNKISINYFQHIYKCICIVLIFLKLKKFFKNTKKPIIIIEGASWIGFSISIIILIKKFIKNSVIIYRSHNVEYDLRKQKNSFFISCLTKCIEKIVFRISNYSTVVSKPDQKRIYNLYKIKPLILENSIDKDRLKFQKKISHPNQFLIFTGSYEYFSNKQAIDNLVYRILPKLIIKYKNIKLIITGKGLPENIIKKKFVIFYDYLPKKKLIYLIKKSSFILLPFKKSPGTKLKIIEALMLGALVITTKHAIKGINISKKIGSPLIYKSSKEMNNLIKITLNKKINRKKISLYYQKELSINDTIDKLKINEF